MIHTVVIAFFCAAVVSAQVEPMVRVTIQERTPIVVGQPVHIQVLVLVPNYFTGSPEFPQLDIGNAIVVLPEETPQNTNESNKGVTYAGISRTYVIYPQQPGRLRIPPKEITVKYAADPPHSVEAHLSIPSVSFEAIIPPEAANLDYFLPTTSLTLKQTFGNPLRNLKAGDTINRTIIVTASRLRAMLIPPTNFGTPDGISVYRKQPVVTDIKTDRGEFIEGRRVDSATYLIRQPGEFELPEISVNWWDVQARKVRTALLPAVHFHASPNPSAKPELAPEPEPTPPAMSPAAQNPLSRYRQAAKFITGLSLLLIVSWWIWSRFGSRLQARWKQIQERRRNSEFAAFAKLKNAIRLGDANETFRLLLIWLNRFHPGSTLDEFLSSNSDIELTNEVNSLATLLYGRTRSSFWSGKLMITRLEHARTRNRRKSLHKAVLPPLNP